MKYKYIIFIFIIYYNSWIITVMKNKIIYKYNTIKKILICKLYRYEIT